MPCLAPAKFGPGLFRLLGEMVTLLVVTVPSVAVRTCNLLESEVLGKSEGGCMRVSMSAICTDFVALGIDIA